MNYIASIVRTVVPGAACSHRVGRYEVGFLAPYRPCLHAYITSHDVRMSMKGRTWQETIDQANMLAETFNNCCYVDGVSYAVELVEDESPLRAPTA